MKALVIDMRDGGDWSMDLLFAGLVQNLGIDNVLMYPLKDKHLQWNGLDRDWGKERRSFGHTEENHLIEFSSITDIKKQAATGELTHVFLDERIESFEQYLKLGLCFTNVKVVVVAGHDEFQNRSPDYVKTLYGKNFHMMFLDNWRSEWGSLPYARLMNLSSNWDHFWDVSKRDELLKNKVYDICFMGYNSHPDRNAVMSFIEKEYGHLNNHIVFERRPGTAEAFVSHKDFFETMAQSRICINLPGAAFGGRAMRFYQIPYVGSFMLSQKFPGNQLHPFVDGRDCLYFDSLQSLNEKIKLMLDAPLLREKIAKDGHEHAMKYHTAKSRIAYVLHEVNNG